MEHGQELEKRGCKVVMVGFGVESNAKEWMKANSSKFPFPFVLDPEFKLYRELGIKRSVAGVWTVPILVGFAENLLAGTLNVDHFEGDDVHVLAGNYITDSSGKLVLAYSGETSEDRPSIQDILTALDSATA